MSSTSGFGDASDHCFRVSPNASFGPTSARMPDHALAGNSSPNADRAREPSPARTVRIACSTSSRAVPTVSTVVYTQAYPCPFSRSASASRADVFPVRRGACSTKYLPVSTRRSTSFRSKRSSGGMQ